MTIRVYLDCSVFSSSAAVGRFAGELQFSVLPRIGETVAFPVVVERVSLAEFSPHIRVKSLLHVPSLGADLARTQLELEDAVLPTEEMARAVLSAFGKVPGLFSEFWDE